MAKRSRQQAEAAAQASVQRLARASRAALRRGDLEAASALADQADAAQDRLRRMEAKAVHEEIFKKADIDKEMSAEHQAAQQKKFRQRMKAIDAKHDRAKAANNKRLQVAYQKRIAREKEWEKKQNTLPKRLARFSKSAASASSSIASALDSNGGHGPKEKIDPDMIDTRTFMDKLTGKVGRQLTREEKQKIKDKKRARWLNRMIDIEKKRTIREKKEKEEETRKRRDAGVDAVEKEMARKEAAKKRREEKAAAEDEDKGPSLRGIPKDSPEYAEIKAAREKKKILSKRAKDAQKKMRRDQAARAMHEKRKIRGVGDALMAGHQSFNKQMRQINAKQKAFDQAMKDKKARAKFEARYFRELAKNPEKLAKIMAKRDANSIKQIKLDMRQALYELKDAEKAYEKAKLKHAAISKAALEPKDEEQKAFHASIGDESQKLKDLQHGRDEAAKRVAEGKNKIDKLKAFLNEEGVTDAMREATHKKIAELEKKQAADLEVHRKYNASLKEQKEHVAKLKGLYRQALAENGTEEQKQALAKLEEAEALLDKTAGDKRRLKKELKEKYDEIKKIEAEMKAKSDARYVNRIKRWFKEKIHSVTDPIALAITTAVKKHITDRIQRVKDFIAKQKAKIKFKIKTAIKSALVNGARAVLGKFADKIGLHKVDRDFEKHWAAQQAAKKAAEEEAKAGKKKKKGKQEGIAYLEGGAGIGGALQMGAKGQRLPKIQPKKIDDNPGDKIPFVTHTGKRGGVFYYDAHGNKIYVQKGGLGGFMSAFSAGKGGNKLYH